MGSKPKRGEGTQVTTGKVEARRANGGTEEQSETMLTIGVVNRNGATEGWRDPRVAD
jgi:hypothetical protein